MEYSIETNEGANHREYSHHLEQQGVIQRAAYETSINFFFGTENRH